MFTLPGFHMLFTCSLSATLLIFITLNHTVNVSHIDGQWRLVLHFLFWGGGAPIPPFFKPIRDSDSNHVLRKKKHKIKPHGNPCVQRPAYRLGAGRMYQGGCSPNGRATTVDGNVVIAHIHNSLVHCPDVVDFAGHRKIKP